MLTAQVVTKNNKSTIAKTLESLKSMRITVADLGSSDETIDICESYDAEVYRYPESTYDQARNSLIEKSTTDWQIAIKPNEIIVQGLDQLRNISGSSYYVNIITEQILSKEIRLWNKRYEFKFVNPIFERLDVSTKKEMGIVIYSNGVLSYDPQLIEDWKLNKPKDSQPYYYQSCLLLSQGRYQEFINTSETYMILENNYSVSSIMNRYYYAMVQLLHKKEAKSALQNLAICLSVKPLMAEFWCLAGDVYYHLLNRFDKAKDFYENALILGSSRSKSDKWPMDISKYKEYPTKMIESCDAISQHRSTYVSEYSL